MQYKNPAQIWTTLCIEDWLSRDNHEINGDEEIPGMCITINVIESCMHIPDCMTAGELRLATLDNKHLSICIVQLAIY